MYICYNIEIILFQVEIKNNNYFLCCNKVLKLRVKFTKFYLI